MTEASHTEGDVLLLVDDDPDSLALLQRALGGCGFRLVCAGSGEEALQVARRVRPMLALLDVVMPGIDGYEVCRRLKQEEETRDCAVIFLSALDESISKVQGLELGAVDQGELQVESQPGATTFRMLLPGRPG